MGMGGQFLTPSALPPGKETRYPLYRKLDGPQGWSWRVRKISPPPGFDPRTFHPVASRYTDYAISAQIYVLFHFLYLIKIPLLLLWMIPMNFERFYIVCEKYFFLIWPLMLTANVLAASWRRDRLSLQKKWVPEVLHGGKSDRCVGQTKLLRSCTDILEVTGVSTSCGTKGLSGPLKG
jgi:hypothetical protein